MAGGSAPGRKGATWERMVATWLAGWYGPARRKPRGIGGDDIAVAGPLSFECKDCPGQWRPAEWLTQATVGANGRIPVVVAKRKGTTSPEDAYVILKGSAFRALVMAIRVEEATREQSSL